MRNFRIFHSRLHSEGVVFGAHHGSASFSGKAPDMNTYLVVFEVRPRCGGKPQVYSNDREGKSTMSGTRAGVPLVLSSDVRAGDLTLSLLPTVETPPIPPNFMRRHARAPAPHISGGNQRRYSSRPAHCHSAPPREKRELRLQYIRTYSIDRLALPSLSNGYSPSERRVWREGKPS